MNLKLIAESINQFLWLNLTSNSAIREEADYCIKILLASERDIVNFSTLGAGDKHFHLRKQ